MADESRIKIDKFNGHDFRFGNMQIKDELYQKNLYIPLFSAKPEKMEPKDWDLLVRQAPGVVRPSLDKNVAYNIVGKTTTTRVLKTYKNWDGGNMINKNIFLMKIKNFFQRIWNY